MRSLKMFSTMVVSALTIIGGNALLPVSSAADTATPMAPAPKSCTVTPRTADDLQNLIGVATPGAATDGGLFYPTLPTGENADQSTQTTIAAVLDELTACLNAGDAQRLYALYTDRFLSEFGPISVEAFNEMSAGTPIAESTADAVWIDRITSVVNLDDGRVGAVATIGGLEDPHPAPGKTYYFIFAFSSGAWLIDEQFDRIGQMGENGPLFVADVIDGLPASPTP